MLAAFGCCTGFQAAAETVLAGEQGLIGSFVAILLLTTAMLTPVLASKPAQTQTMTLLQHAKLRTVWRLQGESTTARRPLSAAGADLQGALSPS